MRPHRPTLTLLLLCALAAPVRAQTFYDVEIIVFEQLDTRASEQERWRPRVALPDLEEAAALERDGRDGATLQDLPRGFQPLPAERSRLQDELERLEESEHYRVLRHLLWRQPALEADEAVALRVRAGEPMTLRVPVGASTAAHGPATAVDTDADADAAEPGSGDATPGDARADEAEAAAPEGTARGDATVTALDDSATRSRGPRRTLVPRTREVRAYPLDGTVRLVVSRYLHLHAELYFTTPVEWLDEAATSAVAMPGTGGRDGARAGIAGAAEAPRLARNADGEAMLSYPFVQRRRMRSNELHYLDHPVLGMLVWVTPRGEGDELPVPDTGAS